MKLTKLQRKKITTAQKNEITEYFIYQKLASCARHGKNRRVLRKIGQQEKRHYQFWQKLSGEKANPDRKEIFLYSLLGRFLGLNFALRLMEAGEQSAQTFYKNLIKLDPKGVKKIIHEEEKHEEKLLNLLSQEELEYTGSVVLGLNDALVELTGVLAGLTFALQNTNLIVLTGLITGIAASFSMAGSEYLSTKEEKGKNPLKASLYTGLAYISTVFVLILPYFLLGNPLLALSATIFFALIIIFIFNFYIAVAKGLEFKKRFLEMATISLGVTVLNFIIGSLVKKYFKIEI